MFKRLISIVIVCALFESAYGRVVVSDSLAVSEIYPGTVHHVTVSVPERLTGAEDVSLYVGLDGPLCHAAERLDSLAAVGVAEPTVCVFLQPGVIKDAEGRVLRYNRSNEFDSTDPRFATFLEAELFPFAEKISGVRFTSDPARRTIFGLSSGGIAAFTAAWHRPDLFGKVFIGCATFVPMRGGNDLQAIVRKHEPKPIKIFLQDGYRDTWNPLFGSWYEANVQMASALDFAGYAVATHWSDSGHSVAVSNAIFPQAIQWLADTANVAHDTANNFLAPLLIPGEGWTICTAAYEGVTTEAIYPDSTLRVTLLAGTNRLEQTVKMADGSWGYAEPFYWLHCYDNSLLAVGGMAFDGDGNLWVVTSAGLQICDQNGRVRGILSLPSDIPVSETSVEIKDGYACISSPSVSYRRRMNVKSADGRPKSQGQG